MSAPTQAGWSWCNKCEGAWYSGAGPTRQGYCPANGAHSTVGSGAYRVRTGAAQPGEQSGWSWCNKCEGLWFSGMAFQGKCPKDGLTHSTTGSGAYDLPHNVQFPTGQSGWSFCSKCNGAWFSGVATQPGVCPAGGSHTKVGSGNYQMLM